MTAYKETRKLDDKYNASDIESRCLAFWEKDNTYRFDKTASRENTYVVDTPPPTVSGSLHVGHIMSYTQTDVKVRYQRMKGKSVFYPIGGTITGCRRNGGFKTILTSRAIRICRMIRILNRFMIRKMMANGWKCRVKTLLKLVKF